MTRMTVWADLLPEARVGLAAAPDISVESALRRAAQRFFRETHLWLESMEPIVLEAGVASYPTEIPPGSRVERIAVAKLAGRVCDIGLMRYVDLFSLPTSEGGVEAVALNPAANEVVVWRTPTVSGKTLELLVALAPTLSARGIPDHLADEWHDGIVAGARAEMFANKDMPWFSPEMANRSELLYSEVVARGRREEHSGHHVQLRVTPRPFV